MHKSESHQQIESNQMEKSFKFEIIQKAKSIVCAGSDYRILAVKFPKHSHWRIYDIERISQDLRVNSLQKFDV